PRANPLLAKHGRLLAVEHSAAAAHQRESQLGINRKLSELHPNHRSGAHAEQLLGGRVPELDLVFWVDQHDRPRHVGERFCVTFGELVELARAVLEFLVGVFEFLVQRLQLFVGGLQLFVGGLQLLVRGFQFPRSWIAAPRWWFRALRSRTAAPRWWSRVARP